MLKVIIIDDDPITRKGIRAMMPWTSHGMEIIGEASNGKEALDILSSQKADLALVDLDMPVMNGTSFIRSASVLYPKLNYIVLTVHTEFKYVQEILRLGAIDYIVKNQFDQENFDAILDRIRTSLLHKNADAQNPSSLKWREGKILTPDIYALLIMDAENEEIAFAFLEQNQLLDRTDVYELSPGIWIFTDECSEFRFPEHFAGAMLLHITDVRNTSYAQLNRHLRTYLNNQFFYEYRPMKQVNHKRAYELMESEFITNHETLENLKSNWLSLNWIHDNELFQQLKFDLKNSKMKPASLYHLLLALENLWNTSYSQLLGQKLTLPYFHSWNEVEEWLMHIYEKSNMFSSFSRYSHDLTMSILKAKDYVDTHYAASIEVTEMARQANMSYGYFSRCFRDIVGVSFSDYCIQTRIKQAQKLLLETGNTLQQIASDVGYHDEKYFSRIFKKLTGQTPSEYRKSAFDSADTERQ